MKWLKIEVSISEAAVSGAVGSLGEVRLLSELFREPARCCLHARAPVIPTPRVILALAVLVEDVAFLNFCLLVEDLPPVVAFPSRFLSHPLTVSATGPPLLSSDR